MKQYLDLLEHVLHHGVQRDDRTGTGPLSVFGHQTRFKFLNRSIRLTFKGKYIVTPEYITTGG